MDLSTMETNLDKEVEGVWHRVDSETEVLVARYGNPNFEKALQKLLASLPNAPKGTRLNKTQDKEYEEGLTKIIAETILLGWRGMKYNGDVVPYTVEKAVEFLLSPKLKDFREYVLRLAMDAKYYREEEIKETAGN